MYFLPTIPKDIEERKYQVIVTSPEAMLSEQHLRPILCTPGFSENLTIVVDEAHCITQWGPKFRQAYGRLREIRSLVKNIVPFVLASATLPPNILAEVKASLLIEECSHDFVHLGNYRDNLIWEISVLDQHRERHMDQLVTLLPTGSVETLQSQVLIYVNDRFTGYRIRQHIRSLYSEEHHALIDCYHALRGELTKEWLMYRLAKDELKILICTEAVGMVCERALHRNPVLIHSLLRGATSRMSISSSSTSSRRI